MTIFTFFLLFLVANFDFAGFAPKKRGNGPYCEIPTEKQTIKAHGFAYDGFCHIIKDVNFGTQLSVRLIEGVRLMEVSLYFWYEKGIDMGSQTSLKTSQRGGGGVATPSALPWIRL